VFWRYRPLDCSNRSLLSTQSKSLITGASSFDWLLVFSDQAKLAASTNISLMLPIPGRPGRESDCPGHPGHGPRLRAGFVGHARREPQRRRILQRAGLGCKRHAARPGATRACRCPDQTRATRPLAYLTLMALARARWLWLGLVGYGCSMCGLDLFFLLGPIRELVLFS